MRKLFHVFKYEFLSVVTRRSFILGLILVPMIPSLLIGVIGLFQDKNTPSLTETVVQEMMNPLAYGVVDQSGLIKQYPSWVSGRLVAFADEATARQETADEKLQGFYIISKDYLETGDVTLVKPEISMVSELAFTGTLKELINYNLVEGDDAVYAKLVNDAIVSTQYIDLSKADVRDQSDFTTYIVPFVIAFFFYILIIISSSMMLTSISKEKENRTMELMLSSVSPMDLFLGKIFARGLASLIQTAIWSGTILLIVKLSKTAISLPFEINIPPIVFVVGIPFFLLGYLLYGSLMSGLGALAPNSREGGQYSMLVNMPLIFAFLAVNQFIYSPNSFISIFLSLFPLTSPVVLTTRLVIGAVPVWQILLSILLLIGTTYLVMRAVANLFSSQNLLSGEKFNIMTFLRTLFIGKKAQEA